MTAEPTTIASIDPDNKVMITDAEPEQIVNDDPPAPSPASQAEGTPAEPELSQDPPKAEPEKKPEPTAREALIAKLTQAEDTPAPKKDAEPETPEAAAPKEKVPASETGDTPPPTKTETPAEDDLVDLTNETAKTLKPGEARRKINKLIERVKNAEPMAEGFKEILDICEKNGFAPEDYKAWVNLGIGIQQGDEKAVESFAAMAAKLGVAPVAAPTLPPELDAWVTAQEKDLEISATAAAELRKRLGVGTTPAPKPAAPAPAAPRPAPTRTATADPIVASRHKATQTMDKIADEYEKKIGADRFKELEPRIKAALAQRKGAHPDAWPDIFRATIEAEIAKAPKVATVAPGLRPGTTTAPSTPVFKTERERLLHKYA